MNGDLEGIRRMQPLVCIIVRNVLQNLHLDQWYGLMFTRVFHLGIQSLLKNHLVNW